MTVPDTAARSGQPSRCRDASVRLHVCVSCRSSGAEGEDRPGRRLLDALQTRDLPADVAAAECLGVCRRPVTIALSAPGRWSYVLADAPPDDPDLIASVAALYAAAPDGLVPWRERPDLMKKGIVARIPPLPLPERTP